MIDGLTFPRSAKVLVRAGVGYDNVDINFAASMGLPVCVVPDYGTEEVADATMGLLLAAARKTCYLAQKVKEGTWPTLEAAGSKRYALTCTNVSAFAALVHS